MRLWSHDYAPLGVPLVDADDVAGSVTALIEGLAPPGSRSSLILPMVPLDGPVAAAFRRAAESPDGRLPFSTRTVAPLSSRPAEGDIDLRRALPKKKRHERGRELRRLGEHGEVTIELASAPDIVRARFEEFLVLEAAGWKGEAGSALACRVATAEFAREAIFNRSEGRAARIVSLRLGDHPVAILVCFETGRTSYTWKIAYDETYARYSPGAQIMLDAPRLLFADTAIETIDSCASANHPMIDHLWSERLAVGTLVVGPVGGGAVYKLALAAAEAEIDARAMARRWREGRKKASTGS